MLVAAEYTCFQELAQNIRACTHLKELHVSIPVSLTYEFLTTGDRSTCYDIRFLEEVLSSLPPSTSFVHARLRLNAFSTQAHTVVLDSIRWGHIAWALSGSHDTRPFVVEFTLLAGEFPRLWEDSPREKVVAAFKHSGFNSQSTGKSDDSFRATLC